MRRFPFLRKPKPEPTPEEQEAPPPSRKRPQDKMIRRPADKGV